MLSLGTALIFPRAVKTPSVLRQAQAVNFRVHCESVLVPATMPHAVPLRYRVPEGVILGGTLSPLPVLKAGMLCAVLRLFVK